MDFMEGMEERLSDIRGITLKSLLENPSFLQPPTGNNNEDKNAKKDKEAGLFGLDIGSEDVASAFLGPTLWEKTPYDDLKLEYMDLDEFLSENGIAASDGKTSSQEKTQEKVDVSGGASPVSRGASPVSETSNDKENHYLMSTQSPTPSPHPPMSPDSISEELAYSPTNTMSPVREPSPVHVNVPFELSETDVALATAPGQDTFDPTECTFTEEELKPQPMIKKSRKIYVPDEQKDDKYWERRRKNNIAAKRSREARRVKENQIVIRASYLGKENGALRDDVLELKKENSTLKKIIASYEKRLKIAKMD